MCVLMFWHMTLEGCGTISRYKKMHGGQESFADVTFAVGNGEVQQVLP